jgi:serine/threonine-protein kinase
VTTRTDVFAAGIVLWELSLMQRLFAGRNEVETISLVRGRQIPRPREIDSSYPAALEEVVMGALERDLSRRTASAGVLADGLRSYLSSVAPVTKDRVGELMVRTFPRQPAQEGAAPEGVHGSKPSVATEALSPSTAQTRAKRPERLALRRKASSVGIIGAALALAGVSAFWAMKSATPNRDALVARPPDRGAPTKLPIIDLLPVPGRVPVSTAPTLGSQAPALRQPTPAGKPRDRPRPVPAEASSRPVPSMSKQVAAVVTASGEVPTGTLIVASQQWGTVFVDGADHGPTDLQVALSPRAHSVAVSLSNGAGTFSAIATIEAKKRTKCKVSGNALACEPPR